MPYGRDALEDFVSYARDAMGRSGSGTLWSIAETAAEWQHGYERRLTEEALQSSDSEEGLLTPEEFAERFRAQFPQAGPALDEHLAKLREMTDPVEA